MTNNFIDVTAMPPDPDHAGKHIDPSTGIWPVIEWGSECGRGFVSDERFQRGNEKVIKRTNRAKTRAWRQLERR
jgi:hypothetical protein